MPMESRRGEANQALPDCSLVRLFAGKMTRIIVLGLVRLGIVSVPRTWMEEYCEHEDIDGGVQ
jgi:hypothetical protein